jgi:hypothetical protein
MPRINVRTGLRSIALAACFVLGSTAVMASRPLTTEDAGVIDAGDVELESYYHRQTAHDAPALSGFHVRPNLGIGLRTQLGIGVDTLRQYDEASATRRSSGEYAIAAKTGLKELTDDSYGIALAYGVDRTRAAGERFRYDNAYINSALSVPLGQWLLHANLGWQRSRLAETRATTWALAAERTQALGPIDLAVEMFGTDHDPAWLQVGARWVVKEERLFVDASYGVQTGSSRARLLTVGCKLAF